VGSGLLLLPYKFHLSIKLLVVRFLKTKVTKFFKTKVYTPVPQGKHPFPLIPLYHMKTYRLVTDSKKQDSRGRGVKDSSVIHEKLDPLNLPFLKYLYSLSVELIILGNLTSSLFKKWGMGHC
jgi:hypothetical protein